MRIALPSSGSCNISADAYTSSHVPPSLLISAPSSFLVGGHGRQTAARPAAHISICGSMCTPQGGTCSLRPEPRSTRGTFLCLKLPSVGSSSGLFYGRGTFVERVFETERSCAKPNLVTAPRVKPTAIAAIMNRMFLAALLPIL
jgi:hypothetical protein